MDNTKYVELANLQLKRIACDLAKRERIKTPFEIGTTFSIDPPNKDLVMVAGDPVLIFVNPLLIRKQDEYELVKRKAGAPNQGPLVKTLRESLRLVHKLHVSLSNITPVAQSVAYDADAKGKKWEKATDKEQFIPKIVHRDFEITYNVTVTDKVTGHSVNLVANRKNLDEMLYAAQTRLQLMLTDWESRLLQEQLKAAQTVVTNTVPNKALTEITDDGSVKIEVKYE